MSKREATIRVSRALLIVGSIGVILGIATVVFSTLLYVQNHDFSMLATYLSDIGNTPGWPQTFFNSGMLIAAPVRYLFLVFLVLQLAHVGAGRGFSSAALIIGALVVAGSIGMSAIPYSLNLALHKTSALLYFFGVVILQSLIGFQELRRRLPVVLPVSSLTVVAIYLVFAVLLTLAGKIDGITRNTPVIWEWLAFLSLMFWLAAHSIVLGKAQKSRA
ncbi:MAG: hypothetical protein A2Z08_01390 [Deltaproteobacteria bacterium RBG_16_54_11]|nr:MAG: hypothetical protein A2Z08_01390 [Deltaproteobacteria bacterium RBG_16_54_11]